MIEKIKMNVMNEMKKFINHFFSTESFIMIECNFYQNLKIIEAKLQKREEIYSLDCITVIEKIKMNVMTQTKKLMNNFFQRKFCHGCI